MSKPNVHQKTILSLLSDSKADFLIPDYQRPYAWNQDQCQTLWDDLLTSQSPEEITKNLTPKKMNILSVQLLLFKKTISMRLSMDNKD